MQEGGTPRKCNPYRLGSTPPTLWKEKDGIKGVESELKVSVDTSLDKGKKGKGAKEILVLSSHSDKRVRDSSMNWTESILKFPIWKGNFTISDI